MKLEYVYGRYKLGWGLWRKDGSLVATSQFRKGIYGILEEIRRVTGKEVVLELVEE